MEITCKRELSESRLDGGAMGCDGEGEGEIELIYACGGQMRSR